MTMTNKRFILLVVDGLGVGEMPDVKTTRQEDIGAHTLKNVIKANPAIRLPNLCSLKIPDYFIKGCFQPCVYHGWQRSLGKCSLAHFGADSYMGHQEIAGSKPKKPLQQFITDKKDDIIAVLQRNNTSARYNHGVIFADTMIVIADNIESDYGFNMTVVGSLNHTTFNKILFVGKLVRQVVDVGRVITMGGVGICMSKILKCLEHKHIDGKKINGINIPKLRIYNEQYRVVHLGCGISVHAQAPHIVASHGFPVVLIGKAADVISAENAWHIPAVHTKDVITLLLNSMNNVDCGLLFANVQETDLAGHNQHVGQYSYHLELVDNAIIKILDRMNKNDVFLITGDHGNDPTIGHSFHTREQTPLIFFSKKTESQNFGTRNTLADIGASICNFFSLRPPEYGSYFIS